MWYRFDGREVGHSGNNGSDGQASYPSSITDRTYYYQQETGAFRSGWASGAI